MITGNQLMIEDMITVVMYHRGSSVVNMIEVMIEDMITGFQLYI